MRAYGWRASQGQAGLGRANVRAAHLLYIEEQCQRRYDVEIEVEASEVFPPGRVRVGADLQTEVGDDCQRCRQEVVVLGRVNGLRGDQRRRLNKDKYCKALTLLALVARRAPAERIGLRLRDAPAALCHRRREQRP